MPRWLSSKKLEIVKSLLQDDPAMLLRESMGVAADSTQRAFNSKDIEAFMKRQPVALVRYPHIHQAYTTAQHIMLAVDPSGGGQSAFAVASMCQLRSGELLVRAFLVTNSSSCHISAKIRHETTKCSGCWQCNLTKRGIKSGST